MRPNSHSERELREKVRIEWGFAMPRLASANTKGMSR